MALIRCAECGQKVSSRAGACVKCGRPIRRGKGTFLNGCLGCFGVFTFLITVGILITFFSLYRVKAASEKAEAKKLAEYASAKNAFNENIEKFYQQLNTAFSQGNFEGALSKANEFQRFERLDYKDVKQITKQAEIKSLIALAAQVPASNFSKNFNIYKKLSELAPNNRKYKIKMENYKEKLDAQKKEQAQKDYLASCKIKVLSGSWHVEYGYAMYEGEVMNISNHKLDNVQAIVTWYTKDGQMITSSNALIEYNPLMPGQKSPFKVMKTNNPVMENARLEFAHLLGGKINAFRAEKTE